MATSNDPSTPEDPKALAARLAREAKAKLAAPPPGPALPDLEPVPETTAEVKKRSLADRAAQVTKPISAADALAAARAAKPEPRPEPAPLSTVMPTAPPPPAPRPAPVPAAPTPPIRPAAPPAAGSPPSLGGSAPAVLGALLPMAKVHGQPMPVTNAVVFRALWQAHQARAAHVGDHGLLVASSVLLDAVERVPAGQLVGIAVEVGGQRQAAWIDTARGVLLAIVAPAEVYLAGL